MKVNNRLKYSILKAKWLKELKNSKEYNMTLKHNYKYIVTNWQRLVKI